MTKKERRKLIRTIIAAIYVIVGLVLLFSTSIAILYMYFSGTFLPYKYVFRKVLYVLLFMFFLVGFWLLDQGTTYISRVYLKKRH